MQLKGNSIWDRATPDMLTDGLNEHEQCHSKSIRYKAPISWDPIAGINLVHPCHVASSVLNPTCPSTDSGHDVLISWHEEPFWHHDRDGHSTGQQSTNFASWFPFVSRGSLLLIEQIAASKNPSRQSPSAHVLIQHCSDARTKGYHSSLPARSNHHDNSEILISLSG